MRIAASARKHEVADEDILHAARHPVADFDLDEITMLIGAARNGALLEIGVVSDDDETVVIHAMPLRLKFHRYL